VNVTRAIASSLLGFTLLSPLWSDARAFAPQDVRRPAAVVVSTADRHQGSLEALSKALSDRYGFMPRHVEWIRGAEATSERIESALFEASRRLGPLDELLVVVALELHMKGEDRILKTANFEVGRPWSGLPTVALRKLTSAGEGGTVVVVYPECPTDRGRASGYWGDAQANQAAGGRARALIGFCSESPSETDEFLTDLTRVLTDAAEKPLTRAPLQGADELGLVSLIDIADRLAALHREPPLSIELTGGGGWLRVFAKRAHPEIDTTLASLKEAGSIREVRHALEAIVRSAHDGPAAASASAVTELDRYALDPDVEVPRRVLAVQALGDLGSAEGRAALQHIYDKAGEPEIRLAALHASQVRAAGAEPSLARQALRDRDPEVQAGAIQLLGLAGDTASQPDLEVVLTKSPEPAVRAAAARTLGVLVATKPSPKALVSALADPDPSVRAEAAAALGRVQPDQATVAPLQKALTDDDPRVRESAAYALGQHWSVMSEPERVAVVAALLARARDRAADLGMRAGALWSLARSGRTVDERARVSKDIEPLTLPREPASVRSAAVDALAYLAHPRSVPALAAVVKSSDESADLRLRIADTTALGEVGDPSATDVLLGLTADRRVDVANAARSALTRMNARSDRALTVATDTKAPTAERLLAIDLLGRNRDPDAPAPLLTLLRDPDGTVRERAALALAGYAGTETIEKLGKLLLADEEAEVVRIAAATALGAMRSAEANHQLLRSSSERNQEVRAAAVGLVDPSTVSRSDLPSVLALAKDPNPAVRRAVAKTLGGIDPADSREALETLSHDEAPPVREVAIDALRSLELRAERPPMAAGEVVFEADLAPAERGVRVDVFWCEGEGEEARRERARAYAEDIARIGRDGDTNVVGLVRLKPLAAAVNYRPGYQVTGNQIRFDGGDAAERALATQIASRWPKELDLHPAKTRSPGHLNIFVCASGRSGPGSAGMVRRSSD
jgi:HEAT repeat protein